MKQVYKYSFILVVAVMLLMTSCSRPGGESTGSEFMPDMAHSVAYEANYYNYYYNNTWGSEEEYYEMAKPRLPVKGTVPRRASSSISIPTASDNTPYYYGDTEEERARATSDIIDNPYAITDAAIANGKELYNINCAICHGDKGDGNGYLVRDDGGVYPVQPAILTNEEFVTASNGRYYHSIMHGKNLMGSYKDKLAYSERWDVIHYIRSLQAKATKTKYDHYTNTLNTLDRPAGEIKQVAELAEPAHGHHDDHGHDDHSQEAHGHDHDDHGHEHHDNH